MSLVKRKVEIQVRFYPVLKFTASPRLVSATKQKM